MLTVRRAFRQSGSPKAKALFLVVALGSWFLYFFSHRIFDRTAPKLTINNLTDGETLKTSLLLEITANDQRAGIKDLYLQINDAQPQKLQKLPRQTIKRAREYNYDLSSLEDGQYQLTVTALDRAFRTNESYLHINFSVDRNPPQVHFTTKPKVGLQGNTIAIFMVSNELLGSIEANMFGKVQTFYPLPISEKKSEYYWYRCLVGVSVTQQIGYHSLDLIATDRVGNQSTATFVVEIEKNEFERGGYIKLSPQKQKLMLDKSKGRSDNVKRSQAYTVSEQTSKQLWDSHFIRPASGILTSPFGKYREYNTGIKRHHLGTDIANQTGTAIYASNAGVITLAERLYIYGYSIIINHGQGVSTSYSHLSKIEVAVGDNVEKDQLIGLMGATGQVTGPHLHWHMAVNGVAVAPEQWTEVNFSSPKSKDPN